MTHPCGIVTCMMSRCLTHVMVPLPGIPCLAAYACGSMLMQIPILMWAASGDTCMLLVHPQPAYADVIVIVSDNRASTSACLLLQLDNMIYICMLTTHSQPICSNGENACLQTRTCSMGQGCSGKKIGTCHPIESCLLQDNIVNEPSGRLLSSA